MNSLSCNSLIKEVERAVFEINSGSSVALCDGDEVRIISSVENHAVEVKYLAITSNRAEAIGLKNAARIYGGDVLDIALSEDSPSYDKYEGADKLDKTAIQLMKIAESLPAAIISDKVEDVFKVSVDSINKYEKAIADSLEPVCTSPLTLKNAQNANITVFRAGSKEHYAITVGDLFAQIPLVRIHSSCFTGDLLGSMKCDCGDQLQNALKAIHSYGNGIVLYLMQEGRGIGLVNKLRTYNLQNKGFDTVEANEFLGFDDDERPYYPAASILKKLNVNKVRLLTNNPRKVEGLKAEGINIAECVPLIIQADDYNKKYLETKFTKLNHK